MELVELEGQVEAVGGAGEALPVRLGVKEPDSVCAGLAEGKEETEVLPEAVAQGVGAEDGVLHAQGVALAVRLGLPLADGVSKGEKEREGEAEEEADGCAEALTVPHCVGEREAVVEMVAQGVGVKDAQPLDVGVPLRKGV